MKVRTIILFAALAFLANACATTVCREAPVYKTETKLLTEFSMQQSDLLTTWVSEHCTCDADQKFSTDLCAKSAQIATLAKSRVPWHADMMLFNAGLLEERPGDAPNPPSPSTLCPVATPEINVKDVSPEAPTEGTEVE